MACLQNGTNLLNNNNLSSFKHSILQYDGAHHNTGSMVWTRSSQINNFFNKNCQIPFRNNHTKDITESDRFYTDSMTSGKDQDKCDASTKSETVTGIKRKENKCNKKEADATNSNSYSKINDSIKRKDKYNLFNTTKSYFKPLVETGWTNNRTNMNVSHIFDDDDNSYQVEHNSLTSDMGSSEPSHHARRPMNAFLIFCKRHRTVVKNRYPHLENRAVTKILGEWWAALETEEKACYTELAKQYKNAFFSANPNFKWYKLPAPPLRTLHTRPGNIVKVSTTKQLPDNEPEEKPQQLFTPGKLADETQLGSITSLINSQHVGKTATSTTTTVTDNQIDSISSNSPNRDMVQAITPPQTVSSPTNEFQNYLLSPPSTNVNICQPIKPFKKRTLHQHKDNKNIVRSIFGKTQKVSDKNFDSTLLDQALENFVDTVDDESFNIAQYDQMQDINQQSLTYNNANSNLTQQELIDKVVDRMCLSKTETETDRVNEESDSDGCQQKLVESNNSKETRKSVRSCKGLRYAKFMAEGKLFVNKRTKKHNMSNKLPKPSYTRSNESDKVPRITEPIELNETIKKLAERTLGKVPDCLEESDIPEKCLQESPNTKEDNFRMFRAADFNLDEKIEALPSLSLEKFQQKKRENKKRKFLRTRKKEMGYKKSEADKHDETFNSLLTGSKKRKPRKQSITRLDPQNATTADTGIDLFGLATLAEVAAKKAKIDQNENC